VYCSLLTITRKLNLHFPEGEWEGKWKVKWETVQNAITKEERDEDERYVLISEPCLHPQFTS
jgi:hypothetical protein